jgi:response regulator NasT
MKFVVADDSSLPRDILRQVLTNAGHTVVAAVENGALAVEACRKFKPDAAVLDVSMPVLNGDEAAKMIVAQKTARHVIVVSSAGMDSVIQKLAAIGVRFVSKPYNKHQFLAALNEVLKS